MIAPEITFTLSPPLDQLTTVRARQEIDFNAVVYDARVATVQLRWSADDQTWNQVDLHANGNQETLSSVVRIGAVGEIANGQSYTCKLSIEKKRKIKFGLRCTFSDKETVMPLGDETKYGVLLNLEEDSAKLPLSDVFDGTDSSLAVSTLSENSHNVRVGQMTKSVSSDPSTPAVSDMGLPRHLERFLAFIRIWEPWIEPRTGLNKFSLDAKYKNCIAMAYQRADGYNVVILPLSGTLDSCTSTLRPTSEGHVQLYTQNDSNTSQKEGQKVLFGVGHDLNEVFDAVFEAARMIIHGKKHSAVMKGMSWTQEWYDGLMYCTWNSLGNKMSHDMILSALQDLHDTGLRVTGLIIDDGWQDTNDANHILSFEARASAFPKGLAGLVKDIRASFPYIAEIGVWSTIVGFWEGIEAGSKIDKSYKTVDCICRGEKIRMVNEKDAIRLYDDYFKFLSNCGITCVKIDNQATIDEIDDPVVRGKLWKVYQDAIYRSSVQYFDRKIIYCMSMVQNIFYYALQSVEGPIPIVRNSDDFFPDIPESHFWHVYVNIFNSIFTRRMYALPDYDMFQSDMAGSTDDVLGRTYATLHAAARCISGGPIYITDTPKMHNMSLLEALSAPSPSKNSIVLRPNKVAEPVSSYHFFKSSNFLRVSNVCGADDEIRLLALLNISLLPLVETIGLRDMNVAHAKYVLRSYRSGKIWDNKEQKPIALGGGEWDVLTAAPITAIGSTGIAVLGLLSNIAGAAGVVQVETEKKNTPRIKLRLKAFGVIGIWISDLSTRPLDSFHVFLEGQRIPVERLRISQLLEIDIRDFVESGGSGKSVVEVEVSLR